MQIKHIISRNLEYRIREYLDIFPAVAILGPRQCGKSTLAKAIVSTIPDSIYLDLEKRQEKATLEEPELFFENHPDQTVCLDEVQRLPEIFQVLRWVIDENRRKGRFIILGSASRDLIKQSSETLAGRIGHLELTPFLLKELEVQDSFKLLSFWSRGGFPESYLAMTDQQSMTWRNDFIRTFLEKDIPQLGFNIAAETLNRLWIMCAHNHGQLLNSSSLGEALGLSHTTIRNYLELLSQTFILRILPPYFVNLKKRLVKTPKIYVRDCGILHALLNIDNFDQLLGHPVFGASWEGFAMENIISSISDSWNASFYRTSSGNEIDLVLKKGLRRIAVEFKASKAPKIGKGFHLALSDLKIDDAIVVAPVDNSYPVTKKITVMPLSEAITKIRELE